MFPVGLKVPLPIEGTTPVKYAAVLGEIYLAFADYDRRKNNGQYLTSAPIAKFMAESFSYSKQFLRVLDPGSGSGILSAAVCETASARGTIRRLHINAYETDPLLANLTRLVLAFSQEWLIQRSVVLTFNVRHEDFVLKHVDKLKTNGHTEIPDRYYLKYGLVISNPPYFKIRKGDPRIVAGASVVHGQPNIYALFMSISAELLSENGELVCIVPRSFASGQYFKKFREVFFQHVAPTAIHLFESRKDLFKNQTVLQENMVITARNRREGDDLNVGQVLVSHSKAVHDLSDRKSLVVQLNSVLNLTSVNKELCIPVRLEDLELMDVIRSWPNTLHSLGLEISTGPIVPFRATEFLTHDSSQHSSVPLVWMHHVHPMRIEWPSISTSKPQWIKSKTKSVRLLQTDQTYILLRRFSSKEEKQRLVAAPLFRGCLNAHKVGLENHLNYIRGVSRELDEELAYGLAALLNSTFLDRYFRLFNGNTQVSATELRSIPLPNEQDIRTTGATVSRLLSFRTPLSELDAIISRTLNLSFEL